MGHIDLRKEQVKMGTCHVCFRHCQMEEGKSGFCGVRICKGGRVIPANYGKVTSLALDPIEKKPLSRFYPGSMILSVGSTGCNLRCPFCQNYEISWSDIALGFLEEAHTYSPEALAEAAWETRERGNIGLAFTYNEPLVGYEFVRDTAELVHQKGMKNVLVTNGTAELSVLEELLPYIDAMNVDLKGFTQHYYKEVLSGDLETVKRFIARAVKDCHVELTTLIVPGENDTEQEIRQMSRWIASLDPEIPLHISRFFPRFHMTDRAATNVGLVYALADTARENLKYVYTGNC